MRFRLLAILAVMTWSAGPAMADPEACRPVRFSDAGEQRLVIRTAAAAAVLEALGYEPEAQPFPPTESLALLANGEIDVFLGADPRTHATEMAHYRDLANIETLGINILFPPDPAAMPAAAAPAKAPGPAAEDGKAAAPTPRPAPRPPEVVETPSGAKPARTGTAAAPPVRGDGVGARTAGAEPAPGDAPEAGPGPMAEAAPPPPPPPPPAGIETMARAGYAAACPNAAAFFGNLSFPPELEDFVARRMTKDYEEPFDGVIAWLSEHRQVLESWLAGVRAFDGSDPMEAVAREFAF